MCQDDLKGRCSCLGLWVEDGVLGLEEGDRGGEDERKEGRGRVVREGRVAVARTWDRRGWERCERERGVGREGAGAGLQSQQGRSWQVWRQPRQARAGCRSRSGQASERGHGAARFGTAEKKEEQARRGEEDELTGELQKGEPGTRPRSRGRSPPRKAWLDDRAGPMETGMPDMEGGGSKMGAGLGRVRGCVGRVEGRAGGA